MQDKICIVTGGNTGIGYAIAKSLAQLQAHVVIVSRNSEKGKAAADSIGAAVKHATVDVVVGDLGSLASIRRVAAELGTLYPKIDVLINNAGVWMTKLQINEDGFEQTFMTNHLAPFMLNQLLLPNLKAAAPARIVTVNSGLYVKGKVDLEKTPVGADFGRISTYANSKMYNILTLEQQARQLEGAGVTLNMVHPGVIRSNLGESTGLLAWCLRQVKRLWRSPDQGAAAPVWLATNPDAEKYNGAYFDELKETPLIDEAKDVQLAAAVWEQCQSICFPTGSEQSA